MRRNEVTMNSKPNSKIIILLTLGIVFGLSLIFTANLNSNVGISDEFSNYSDDSNLDNENLKISAVSEKIHIINNSGWVVFRSAGNCTGNGTYSEPYIIKDLVIDGGGLGDCIFIENSNLYFRIENCTIYNSGFNWAGIKLKSVSNGTLFNNTASNNNQHGILLDGSNINNITENYANNNFDDGINLQDSDRNNISGNIVVNNNINGINVANSRYNDIIGNEVQRNTEYGINLPDSRSNNILGNNVIKNGAGIYLNDSSYNSITGNDISFNIGRGILLSDDILGFGDTTSGNSNTVSGNTISNNGGSGIYFSHNYWSAGSSNTISGNSIDNNNGNGLELRYSDFSGISGNSITNNSGSGIYLSRCHFTSVSGNIISNNSYAGIWVLGADYDDEYWPSHSENTITGNKINKSIIGVYVFNSYSNNVDGNTVNNNSIGIKLVDSKHNDITGNEVHYNLEYGIYLEISDSNSISMNTLTNNPIAIYLYGSKNNWISANVFSDNGVNIKEVGLPLPFEITIVIVIPVVFIAIIIVGTIIRKKVKANKSRLPKDEVVRYEITQKLEKQGSTVSDYDKYKEIEWRYCKMCKKIVEPTPTKGLLKAKRKLVRKKHSGGPSFLIQARNQACPHCGKRLIPKELKIYRYYCIFAFCFWVIWASIMFPTFMIANIPTRYAEIIGGVSFLGLLIGFSIYSKLILVPRLKKKMQLG